MLFSPKVTFLAFLGFSLSLSVGLISRTGALPSTPNSAKQMPMGHGSMMASMQVRSEADFLQKMIPHHQEAVETAQLLAAGTNRPEMKKFAADIIRVQTAEIEQMQSWLQKWYPNEPVNKNYHPMMRELKTLKGDALDQAFLEDMKMHHMGAIMMSRSLLINNLAKHPEVRTLANQIQVTQRAEIQQMQGWLQAWFNVPSHPGMGGMMMNH